MERYRPTMSGDVLRAWATDAQAEIDRLRADAEIGRKWRENSGLAEWFPFSAQELDRLRAERDALRNRLVAEIRTNEPGCFEAATASAEAKVNDYMDAFRAAMKRHDKMPDAT